MAIKEYSYKNNGELFLYPITENIRYKITFDENGNITVWPEWEPQSQGLVYEFVENNKMNIVQWFTVDDLNHLKRGGRVSAVAAVFGTMLNIKPVMHVDNEGRLTVVEKVRGRKASINGLVKALKDRVTDKSIAFVSHGDCLDEAEFLASKLKTEAGIENVVISYVGPVIGTHSGPGTLAMFFVGTER